MIHLSQYQVLLAPHVTEKSSMSAGSARQYVFKVAKESNKTMIKQAVEGIFNVTVQSVRTANMKPESVRFRQAKGTRKGWKKAYVTLQQGQELDVAAVKS